MPTNCVPSIVCVALVLISALAVEGNDQEAMEKALFDSMRSIGAMDGDMYKTAQMVNIVNMLRSLGKDNALKVLKDFVDRSRSEFGRENAVFLICRCLFEDPNGWPTPRLGAPTPVASQLAIEKLQHFPLVFSNGVPFLVIRGYNIDGRPEDPYKLLRRCESLALRKADLPLTGHIEAARALATGGQLSELFPDKDIKQGVAAMIMTQAEESAKVR